MHGGPRGESLFQTAFSGQLGLFNAPQSEGPMNAPVDAAAVPP
jgi:hypothetical protein